jgi:hypothetical protein
VEQQPRINLQPAVVCSLHYHLGETSRLDNGDGSYLEAEEVPPSQNHPSQPHSMRTRVRVCGALEVGEGIWVSVCGTPSFFSVKLLSKRCGVCDRLSQGRSRYDGSTWRILSSGHKTRTELGMQEASMACRNHRACSLRDSPARGTTGCEPEAKASIACMDQPLTQYTTAGARKADHVALHARSSRVLLCRKYDIPFGTDQLQGAGRSDDPLARCEP